ncbi:MAG: hypothetical protein H6Q85_2694 [candidate division NC10 bacterium]|nr:hypothetical protein [candidate division NC10 bacterium]
MLHQRLVAHIAQRLTPQQLRDGTHLSRDRRIVGGEVGVIPSRADDQQSVPVALRIERNRCNGRMRGFLEIDPERPSGGRTQLVHQPAGLSEVLVLRLLPCQCHLRRRDAPVIIIEGVEDAAHHHFECGGRAEPRSNTHIARRDGLESANAVPPRSESGSDPPDQRGTRQTFISPGREPLQVHTNGRGKTFGKKCHRLTRNRSNGRHGIEVDGRRENAPVIVICMVPPELGPPRGGHESGGEMTEDILMPLAQARITNPRPPGVLRVQRSERFQDVVG